MGRSPSNTSNGLRRRVRPVMEGLEERRVMNTDFPVLDATDALVSITAVDDAPILYSSTTSAAQGAPEIAQTVASRSAPSPQRSLGHALPMASKPGEGFSRNYQQFTYSTPQGTRVTLSIQGRGSLEGTYTDADGALHLRYDRSNSYTKIVSNVRGGDGRPKLASILSRDLADTDSGASLSGIGSPVIGMINLRQFDLIAGGTINVTSGLGVLGLRSAGPGSQIQLRELSGMLSADDRADARGNTPTYNNSLANIIDVSGTSAPDTPNPIISDLFLVQTLAGSDGEFLTAGNLLLQSDPVDPGPPKPPPGVVIAIDHIYGDSSNVPDLLTDPRIFGYDPTTGQVLRFQLDLNEGTGVVDGTFAPLSVAGSPADVGLGLGRDGDRLVLLVNTGAAISVYDATYGTSLGSFTVPAGYSVTGSTDTVTVIGSIVENQLLQVDVTASLAAGYVVPPADNPAPYTPPGGLSLLGGLTGIPASNNVYSTVAATFNSLQPLEDQLGYLNVTVTTTTPDPEGGAILVNRFSTAQQQAFAPGGRYVPIPSGNPEELATAVGSVDRSLAINTGVPESPEPNTIFLYSQIEQTQRDTITLDYGNQLSDLSESFRPDLAGSVIIDVQGTIQSIRGSTAEGLVLNNSGLLYMASFQSLRNSTIIAHPVGHLRINHRDNVTISSTERTVAGRGGVTFVPNLQQIGPLSHTRNRP